MAKRHPAGRTRKHGARASVHHIESARMIDIPVCSSSPLRRSPSPFDLPFTFPPLEDLPCVPTVSPGG